MYGLAFLAFAAIWLGFGYGIFALFTQDFKFTEMRKTLVTLAFLSLWLCLPFIDDFIGRAQFNSLCEQLPKPQIIKKIAVGPGALFDESGRAKFKTFAETGKLDPLLDRQTSQLMSIRSAETVLSGYAILIKKRVMTAVNKESGEVIYELLELSHKGGFLSRNIYRELYTSCRSGTHFRPEQLFEFKK